MMGIVSTVLLPEGAVAIELPRLALLDLELLGSIPEENIGCACPAFVGKTVSTVFPTNPESLTLTHDVAYHNTSHVS